MKVAQVAPLYESVPPKLYGGTERIVSYLTEELISQGHEVTLFASGDSRTRAPLIAVIPEALRLRENCEDMLAPHIVQLQEVMERAEEFDIIHFHTDYLSYPFATNLKTPHVTTLHGKLTVAELQLIYDKFTTEPVVSISESQRKPLPQAHYVATVLHGVPGHLFRRGKGEGGYYAFLGRISPEKRCDRAIEIAIATYTPLIIAAKIDKVDREYFDTRIRHLLDHPLIDFIGEIGDEQKQEFLGNAKALLFPIDWPEPFGLVMIEAMACGTPVIGWNMGSVPEIIEDGRNGYIVNTIKEAVDATQKLSRLDRAVVRDAFEKKFTASRMAADYLDVYQTLIAGKDCPASRDETPAPDFLQHTQSAKATV